MARIGKPDAGHSNDSNSTTERRLPAPTASGGTIPTRNRCWGTGLIRQNVYVARLRADYWLMVAIATTTTTTTATATFTACGKGQGYEGKTEGHHYTVHLADSLLRVSVTQDWTYGMLSEALRLRDGSALRRFEIRRKLAAASQRLVEAGIIHLTPVLSCGTESPHRLRDGPANHPFPTIGKIRSTS